MSKIVLNDRSHAVHLPKELRFEGSEVSITKVGNKVILEPFIKEE